MMDNYEMFMFLKENYLFFHQCCFKLKYYFIIQNYRHYIYNVTNCYLIFIMKCWDCYNNCV